MSRIGRRNPKEPVGDPGAASNEHMRICVDLGYDRDLTLGKAYVDVFVGGGWENNGFVFVRDDAGVVAGFQPKQFEDIPTDGSVVACGEKIP